MPLDSKITCKSEVEIYIRIFMDKIKIKYKSLLNY